MSNNAKFQRNGLNLTHSLLSYVRERSADEDDHQRSIRLDTALLPNARMMISPEQGQVMHLLTALLQPKKILEVGVFTGYSATWLARSLPPSGGQIYACELDPTYLQRAQSHWDNAGLTPHITPLLGPASDSLQSLLDSGHAETFDAVFVDADKTGYDTYYTLGLQLLRPGGLMLFDNVLWGGSVADPNNTEPDTQALREISLRAHNDPSTLSAILTDGDGLLAVWKLPDSTKK